MPTRTNPSIALVLSGLLSGCTLQTSDPAKSALPSANTTDVATGVSSTPGQTSSSVATDSQTTAPSQSNSSASNAETSADSSASQDTGSGVQVPLPDWQCQGKACDDPCDPAPNVTGYCSMNGACVPQQIASACDEQCVVGSTFDADDGCNRCVCGPTGLRKDATCTEQACDPCTSNDDCPSDQYCNHGHQSCSGSAGSCIPKPTEPCPADPITVCGCDGQHYKNACEASRSGVDTYKHGVCPEPAGGFRCGDRICGLETECGIHINDVSGPGQRDDHYTCFELPKRCLNDRSCKCLGLATYLHCDDSKGIPVVFYPGG